MAAQIARTFCLRSREGALGFEQVLVAEGDVLGREIRIGAREQELPAEALLGAHPPAVDPQPTGHVEKRRCPNVEASAPAALTASTARPRARRRRAGPSLRPRDPRPPPPPPGIRGPRVGEPGDRARQAAQALDVKLIFAVEVDEDLGAGDAVEAAVVEMQVADDRAVPAASLRRAQVHAHMLRARRSW